MHNTAHTAAFSCRRSMYCRPVFARTDALVGEMQSVGVSKPTIYPVRRLICDLLYCITDGSSRSLPGW